jgi:hypothetical protein
VNRPLTVNEGHFSLENIIEIFGIRVFCNDVSNDLQSVAFICACNLLLNFIDHGVRDGILDGHIKAQSQRPITLKAELLRKICALPPLAASGQPYRGLRPLVLGHQIPTG